MKRIVFFGLLFASAAWAQPVVSPAGWEDVRGNQPTVVIPWLQIHADLRGAPRTITGLAFRFGAPLPTATPSRLTLDVLIGDSDYARRTTNVMANFVGPTHRAISQATVDLPDWSARPPVVPAPFDWVLPFQSPWSYSGQSDFAYMVTFAANVPGRQMDGFANTDELTYPGFPYGQGCLATGQSRPMELQGSIKSGRGGPFRIGLAATHAPPYAKSVLLLGASPDAWNVPILCSHAYVAGIFHGVVVFASGGGTASFPEMTLPFEPTIAGLDFFAQVYSLDDGRHPQLLPVSVTNGLELEFPPAPPPPVNIALLFGLSTLFSEAGAITEFR